MRRQNLIGRILEWSTKVLQSCCAAIMAFLLLAVVIQVFARYVLGNPTSWSEPMSQIMFIWLTVFGCAVVIRDREALSVDLLQGHLKGASFHLVQAVCDAISIVVCALWLYSSILQVDNTWEIMEGGLPIRRGMIYIGIAIAFGFMLLYEIVNFISAIRAVFIKNGGEKEVSN